MDFTPEQQGDIRESIRLGWANSDTTERELVEHVVKLHEAVEQAPEPGHDALRTMLLESFRAEFARPAATDRSRVLNAVHRAIEAQRPGSTGVSPSSPSSADDWLALQPEARAMAPATKPANVPRSPSDASTGDGDADGELDPAALEAIQLREMREARLWAVQASMNKMMGDTARMMAKF